MKILHTSDWHLGKSLETISRIAEQRQFVEELYTICDREEIDLVLIAGDVFDTYNPSSAAEELFYEAIEKLNKKGSRAIVIIAGNHDSPDRLCAASPLASKNGIFLLGYPGSEVGIYSCDNGNVKLTSSGPGWLELKLSKYEYNAVIAAVPYPSEARLDEVISRATDEGALQLAYSDRVGSLMKELSGSFREDTVNLLASHLYMRDGKISDSERQLGGALIVEPEALPENAHYVALGHLHRPQRVKAARVPAYYSGSPIAYSFSEVDYAKAVFVIEAQPSTEAAVREVNLSSGKQLKQWRAKNGIEEAMQWCEEKRDFGCWIDLEIYTDRVITQEEQKLIRELNPGIINIRPKIKNERVEEIECKDRETRRMDELFFDYFMYKTGMEAASELMDVFLDIINHEEQPEVQEESRGEGLETKIS